MNFSLTSKVAIVVGGGSWIGKEIAKVFALAGAKVFVVGTTLSKVEETATEISRAGGNVSSAILNVKNGEQVKELFHKISSEEGRIDIVVNSSAIYPNSMIDTLRLDEWREVIDVNLTGTFIILKYAAEIMKKDSQGKIIFISSIAGETLGIPGYSHYAASKAGVCGLMRSAAVELAEFNINVNCISPGNIVNHERFNIDNETLKKMEKSIPIGRTGKPIDVANLALFLAADESNFITGQEYIIDGGEVIS